MQTKATLTLRKARSGKPAQAYLNGINLDPDLAQFITGYSPDFGSEIDWGNQSKGAHTLSFLIATHCMSITQAQEQYGAICSELVADLEPGLEYEDLEIDLTPYSPSDAAAVTKLVQQIQAENAELHALLADKNTANEEE